MRELRGRTLGLKYHPLPSENDRREYVIGEALLKWYGVPEDQVLSLRNASPDPPDLVFDAEGFGEIRIEVTESVPYDRRSVAISGDFLKKLKAELKVLGTRPPKPSNIFVSREPFAFPSMKRQEIKTIAREIDRFLNNKDFEAKYKTTQKIVASPIEITFIPALGAFRYPPTNYDDNLQLRDITGYPLDQEEFIHTFERIIGKKGVSESAADILIVFQGTVGIVDLDRELLAQVEDRLTKALNYQGLYIVDIIPFVSDYWVNIVTVREHPVFKKNSA